MEHMTDRNIYGDELCSCCWLPVYSCANRKATGSNLVEEEAA